jgi:hypothetical protein
MYHVAGVFSVFILTFVVQLTLLVVLNDADEQWPPAEHLVVGNLSCLLIFGMQLFWLCSATGLIWYPYQGAWVTALAFEVTIAVFSVIKVNQHYLSPHHIAELVLSVLRCVLLLIIIFWEKVRQSTQSFQRRSGEEHQPLLGGRANVNEAGYGSAAGTEAAPDEEAGFDLFRRQRETKEIREKYLKEGGNWFAYAKEFRVSIGIILVSRLFVCSR